MRDESELERILRAFRKELQERESEQFGRMGQRWLEVERALELQLQALADDVGVLVQQGRAPSEGQIYQMERYRALLAQVQLEAGKYQAWAQGEIGQEQRVYFGEGERLAEELVRVLAEGGIAAGFNRLKAGAVETMAGMAGDEAPLFSVLKARALTPDAVEGLTRELVKGAALGWNPKKTAAAMKDGLAQGLNKALTIARTEQIRALRLATLQTYQENQGVVKGWVWQCARDLRTCAVCWSMHGSKHPLEEFINDHVCGRCMMVPLMEGVQYPTGEEYFRELSKERQEEILGPARFAAWKEGRLAFGEVAQVVEDPVWGKGLRLRAMRDAPEGKKYIQLSRMDIARNTPDYSADELIRMAGEGLRELSVGLPPFLWT